MKRPDLLRLFKNIDLIIILVIYIITLLNLYGQIAIILPLTKITLTFSAILFCPGYLVSMLIFNKRQLGWLERIPASFCFSIAIIAILGFLAYKTYMALNLLLNIILVVGIIMLLLQIFREKQGFLNSPCLAPNTIDKSAIIKNEKYFSIAVWIIAFLFSYIMFKRGALMNDISGDVFIHLSGIYKRLSLPFLSPVDSQLVNAGMDNNNGYGVWHLSLALLTKLSTTDHTYVWFRIPLFLAPLSIFAYYVFAKELFKNHVSALASLIFFIYFSGIILYGGKIIGYDIISYPSGVSLAIFIPISYFFIFRYLNNQDYKFLFAGAFLGFAISAIHVLSFFLFLFSLISFILFSQFWGHEGKKHVKNLIFLFIIIISIFIPYQLMKGTDLAIRNPVLIENQSNKLLIIKSWLYFIDPRHAFTNVGWVYAAQYFTYLPIYAFLLSPFLILFRKTEPLPSIFLFSNMVIPYSIMFNPLVVPLLTKNVSVQVVYRIYHIVPVYLVLGFFIAKFCTLLKGQLLQKYKAKLTIFLLPVVIVLLIMYQNKILYFLKYSMGNYIIELMHKRSYAQTINDIPEKAAIDFIKRNSPIGCVILTDAKTGYILPAYTGCYVIALPIKKFETNVADPFDRIKDVETALDESVPLADKMSILNKYKVNYILINLQHTSMALLHQFDSDPVSFNKIYNKKNFAIYRYEHFQE